MKMTALDCLTESANDDALRALLDTLSETIGASESAAMSVATAADRWQENLISDDLLKIKDDLKAIRSRVLSLSDTARKNAIDARARFGILSAQESATPAAPQEK